MWASLDCLKIDRSPWYANAEIVLKALYDMAMPGHILGQHRSDLVIRQ
jgi:hypothetical protein